MKIMGNEVQAASMGIGAVGSLLVSGIVMSLGIWVFLDDRYAHAADVTVKQTQMAADMSKQTATLATQIEYSSDRNSKRYIEDQLFKLEQISPQRMTDAERAQMAKYRRDLQSLERVWQQRGMVLR